ncbi:MAG: c-type cytochrome biogenesis protein CcmI [Variibacter sp.]|nr:c-type cytochrome biogenesis protein CcmI [Variibacter sp.]
MTLWFILAMMTAAAIFAVLWPLGRARPVRQGSDLDVYRDQLAELERDRQAGLIGAAEYEAARVEVARRLLAAADAGAETVETVAPAPLWRRRLVAVGVFALLPLGAGLLYAALGVPSLPGAPLAARTQTPLAERPIESLVAQVEAHLERHPEDGRGWEVVAPVYLRLGRFEDAVTARLNALRLNGATADREADYGEALVAAANGVVTREARAAFERALARDREHAKARYYLGLAAEQDGRREQAADIWRGLLAAAPENAPWVALVRQSLARLAAEPGAGGTAESGPSADELAAAARLAPEERAAMVRGMVERLAARLRENGSDLEGWRRLIRAYMVLGEREKAQAALADARRAASGEPDKLREINELGRTLGLGDS